MSIAITHLSDSHAAHDVAQEVFERAFAHAHAGQVVSASWLYLCARNVIGSEYQRRARALRAQHLIGDPERVDGHEEQVALTHTVAAAIRTLEPLDQDVVALSYWAGLKAPEVAALTGLTDGAVRTRLTRARARLDVLLRPTLREEAS